MGIFRSLIAWMRDGKEKVKKKQNDLHLALKSGDLKVIEMNLQKGVDINFRYCGGNTPLHIVLQESNTQTIEICSVLLKRGANAKLQNEEGQTPLHLASRKFNNSAVLCELLLEGGAELNVKDKKNRTALHFAIENCNVDVFDLLLINGADCKIKDNHSNTPLLLALKKCRLKMAKDILQKATDVDVNAHDLKGNTPLHIVLQESNTQTIELCSLLLERGADVHLRSEDGQTTLHAAIPYNPDCVALILRKVWGKNVVNIPDKWRNPLHTAVIHGHHTVVKQLVDNGAEIDCKDVNGMTPLHLASRKINVSAEICKLLLDGGAQNNVMDKNNRTALHYAVEDCNDEVFELLMVNGADVNIKDNHGNTQLLLALKNSRLKLAKDILQKTTAVDVNVKDCDGNTPLHLALQKPQTQAIELCSILLEKGADVQVKNEDGQTPLHIAIPYNPNCVAHILREVSGKNALNIPEKWNKSRNPLHTAVTQGHHTVVKQLLDNGADIDCKDVNGMTPLHLASRKCHKSATILKMLLNKGAQINVSDKENRTALHYAVEECNVDIFNLLLINGADFNKKDNHSNTPLLLALKNCRLKMAKDILQKALDVDVNVRDCDGNTPIHIALQKPQTQTIELCSILLEKGADVQVKNEDGQTPLHIAIPYNPNCVALLLSEVCGKNVVNIPDKWRNPLHTAVIHGHHTVVKQLVDNGAEIDCKDVNGMTPLHFASRKFNNSAVISKLLLEGGAQLNVKDINNRTALHYAVEDCNVEVFELLMVNGADVNITDNQNDTPFNLALKYCRLKMAKYILQRTTDVYVNVYDRQGNTPLHIALLKPHTQAIELCSILLEKGADVQVKNEDGQTPLHSAIRRSQHIVPTLLKSPGKKAVNIPYKNNDYPLHVAARMGDVTLIKLLLDNGADIDCKDLNGQTPVHMAWREPEMTVLLEAGALVNVRDKYGKTPIEEAIERDNKTVHILLKYGADIFIKNNSEQNFLHTAVKYNNHEALELLLKYGADFNCTDNHGESPLHAAVRANNCKGVDILLKCGAHVNCKDIKGWTPLMCTECRSITESLLQMGAKVNIQDHYGKTALHHLVSRFPPDSNVVDMMLDWGATPTITDLSGKQPFIRDVKIKELNIRKECVNLPSVTNPDDYHESYRTSCKEEADRLKEERLGNHSLYCIFSQYGEPRYFKNKELEKAVNQKDLANNFPIYNCLLKSTYKKAKDREDLVEAVLHTILTPLPEEVMRHILSFVDDDSLQRVMEARNLVDT